MGLCNKPIPSLFHYTHLDWKGAEAPFFACNVITRWLCIV